MSPREQGPTVLMHNGFSSFTLMNLVEIILRRRCKLRTRPRLSVRSASYKGRSWL